MVNPWIAGSAPEPLLVEKTPTLRVWRSQSIEVEVRTALPQQAAPEGASLWVVGAHGGAGTSTWAHLLSAGDASCAWPVTGGAINVLVCARAHRAGLEAARAAAIQWASGALPMISLVGLILTPDAPGRTPKPLREHLASVGGTYPQVFSVPWIEQWRFEAPHNVEPDRKVARIIDSITGKDRVQ